MRDNDFIARLTLLEAAVANLLAVGADRASREEWRWLMGQKIEHLHSMLHSIILRLDCLDTCDKDAAALEAARKKLAAHTENLAAALAAAGNGPSPPAE